MAYTNKMKVIYGTESLGLEGEGFSYIFSYRDQGLASIKIAGKEWLYRIPTPSFWRATTDNDRGNGFNLKSSQWLASDMFTKCINIDVTVNDHHFEKLPAGALINQFSGQEEAQKAEIKFTYQTLTIPATKVDLDYLVKANGEMKVTAHYYGKKGLPELPVFGIKMIMPTKAIGFDYKGLSGETYPDRMAGAQKGEFHVSGLPVTKYLVPQENGMHMQTERLTIVRNSTQNNADHSDEKFSLTISQAEQPFNFSCLPYTSEELENATHMEELPLPRRTVLLIAGAVRGVGGIDSWGADVEPEYHISAEQDMEFSFIINKK